MKVSDGKTVSINYTMSIENGETIDSNEGSEPLAFIQGNHQIFEALEKSLYGMTVGESKTTVLKPEDAYGQIIPEAVVAVPFDHFPEDAREIGAVVQTNTAEGQTIKGKVVKLDTDDATIDFNHPLAGKALSFNIKIISVTDDD